MKRETLYYKTLGDAQEAYMLFKQNPVAYSVEKPRFSKSSEVWYFQLTRWSLD